MSYIRRQSQTNPECEKWPWTDPCSELLQRCAAWGEPTSLPQFLFLSFCLRPLGRSWEPRIMLLLLLLLLLLFTCWAPCLLASPNISQVHQCVFKPCYVKNHWSNCDVYSGKCKHMRCHTMNTFFHFFRLWNRKWDVHRRPSESGIFLLNWSILISLMAFALQYLMLLPEHGLYILHPIQ